MRREILAAMLLAACKSRPAPDEHLDAQRAEPSATAASSPLPSAIERESDDAAKKTWAEYVEAIGRGRKATVAKRWSEATQAFDEALAARPNDARALAEKGYAELLAKSYRHALDDLRAASATSDAKLGAQVWFNLGLADEALKNEDDALVDFWFADRLHPSDAARAKIGGRAVCPVRVTRVRTTAVHATSWLDVARTLSKDGNEAVRDAVPKTEAAAKAALRIPGQKPLALPGQGEMDVVRVGTLESAGYSTRYVVQVSGGDFWVYPNRVGEQLVMNMLPSPEPVVTLDRLGRWVRAQQEETPFTNVLLCSDADGGDAFECTGDPREVPVGPAARQGLGSPVYTDHIYDPEAHAEILTVEDDASGRFPSLTDGGRATSLRVDGDALELTGFGCNLRFARGDGGL